MQKGWIEYELPHQPPSHKIIMKDN
jgi:hypothetical protein